MSRENTKTKIVGAIFPILEEHVNNLFETGRNVFVKFTKLELIEGALIVFYVSRRKLLIGEARVAQIERLNPDVAWSRYNKRIFLDKKRYDEYVAISPIGKEKRKMREITVFELQTTRKYEKKVASIYTVTASGRYLSNEMIDEIRKLSS